MNETRDLCGNRDCDLCYPLPRWNVRRVIVLRREYFDALKALTPEEARAQTADRNSSYCQTVIEEQPAVVEPLNQEDLAFYANHGAELCFHTVRARAAAMPERFPRPVTCEWCGNHFRALFKDDSGKQTQGDDCASAVYQKDGEWYVGGNYGSSGFDMDQLRFIANHPQHPLDPVCNQCIHERIAVGDLVNDGRIL